MQEIERKFLIEEFPDLPLLEEAEAFQGYLSVEPVVRIRKKVSKEKTSYVLCFKGKGRLCRKEIELDLPKETFDELAELLGNSHGSAKSTASMRWGMDAGWNAAGWIAENRRPSSMRKWNFLRWKRRWRSSLRNGCPMR